MVELRESKIGLVFPPCLINCNNSHHLRSFFNDLVIYSKNSLKLLFRSEHEASVVAIAKYRSQRQAYFLLKLLDFVTIPLIIMPRRNNFIIIFYYQFIKYEQLQSELEVWRDLYQK